MSQSQHKLDNLLQAWARQRAADASTLHRLRTQILAEAERHTCGSGRGREARQPLRLSPTWLVAAASLLVALGLGYAGFRLGSQDPPDSIAPATDTAVPAFAQLDPPAMHTAATLLAELERIFDQRLQWVAETSGQVRLGIAEPGSHVGGQPTVLVRITVVQRDPARATFQLLWSAQVVGGDQQLVRLGNGPGGAADEPRWQVWAYALPDGRIMVDSELRLPGPVRLHVACGGVQDSGVPTKVYAGRQGDGEFEVYQTVAILKDKVS